MMKNDDAKREAYMLKRLRYLEEQNKKLVLENRIAKETICNMLNDDTISVSTQGFAVPEITNVIFEDGKTIMKFSDGSKKVVKALDKDDFRKDTGVLLCVLKRIFDRKSYYSIFDWIDKGIDVDEIRKDKKKINAERKKRKDERKKRKENKNKKKKGN